MRKTSVISFGAAFFALIVGAQAAVIITNPDAGTSQENTIWAGAATGDRTVVTGGSIATGASIPLTKNFTGMDAAATFTFNNNEFSISNINNKRVGGNIAGEHIRVAFTVDALTDFIFSGSYVSTNTAAGSGRAAFQNVLSDRTTSTDLIPSTSTFTSAFNAGVNPINIPSVSGTFLPGHLYVWDVTIQSLASGTGAPEFSTGTGTIKLAFVPEPASFGLCGIVGTALTIRRRRK